MLKIFLILLLLTSCSNNYNVDDLYLSKYESTYHNSINIYLNNFDNNILELTYKNNTNQEINYTASYEIEVLLNDKWYIIPINEAFNEIAYIINPYATVNEKIDLKKLKLKKGHYRLIKTFTNEAKYPQTIEFDIN